MSTDDETPEKLGRNTVNGRFTQGNKFGRGNPLARRQAQIRSKLFKSASDMDIDEIFDKLIEQAKNGDATARREFLDRILGRSAPANPLTGDLESGDGIRVEIEEIKTQYDGTERAVEDDSVVAPSDPDALA